MYRFQFHGSEEVWGAIMPEIDGTVVLENFRRVSVDLGTLFPEETLRLSPHPRLQIGTPVTARGDLHGVVHKIGPLMTVVQMADGSVKVIDNTDLTYRMGTTIDKPLPPHREVDGYLVPLVEVAREERLIDDREAEVAQECPIDDEEDDIEENVSGEPVMAFARSPTTATRVFKPCPNQWCHKGLHHTGICEAITWETRTRKPTDHYVPSVTRDDVVSDLEDENEPALRRPAPPRDVRPPPRKTVVAHEKDFPKEFRALIRSRLFDLSRHARDANGQRSFKHVTFKAHGEYYNVQKTVDGHNRFMGYYRRSRVGAYVVIVWSLFPSQFYRWESAKLWVEMMTSGPSAEVTQWIERIGKEMTVIRLPTTPIQVEELE